MSLLDGPLDNYMTDLTKGFTLRCLLTPFQGSPVYNKHSITMKFVELANGNMGMLVDDNNRGRGFSCARRLDRPEGPADNSTG
jgi:hypothetical protein